MISNIAFFLIKNKLFEIIIKFSSISLINRLNCTYLISFLPFLHGKFGFLRMQKNPIVYLSQNKDISIAVKNCITQIKLPNLTGKTVLLKPNVGREADSTSAVNTNPDVVEAVFNYLSQKFKARYLIGDSPIINTDTRKAFEQAGYSNLLNNENIEFVDLDSGYPIDCDIPNGKILKKIQLTRYYNQIDYLVSIPVLKMHMHCGASLSFKNLKGLIYKRNKTILHHLQAPELINELKKSIKKVKELDVAISDLAHVLHSDLNIIDASFVQEGMGPSSGNAVKMDTIIVSTNFLAADIVALAITQPKWCLEDVPHLKLISEYFPEMPKSMNDIITKPSNISNFIRQIEPPPTSISIKYKNVRLIDIDSCSACLSTIFNLLKNNKEFIDTHFSSEHPLNLAIGKGIKQSDLYEETYLIGNCTANNKEKGIFIQGCTPIESEIMQKIKENTNLDKIY